MTVRQATRDDRAAVLCLAEAFLGESIFGQWFPFSAADVGELFDLVIVSPGRIFLLEDTTSGAVVGMLVAVPLRDAYSGQGVCDEIAWYVLPAHRQGLGGVKLLKACEAWARTLGLRTITMVAPAGTAVGAFYERFGYTHLETKYAKRLAQNERT